MEPFKYSKGLLSEREFMFALPSIIIGVSILSLPNEVAKVTHFSDGWISILVAGILFTGMALLATHVASHFPDKSFYDYASILVTKPIAIAISFLYVLAGVGISAYTTRSVAFISQQYLFNRTPMEVLGLAFLLVVIYGVSGSRVGLFRLNILFLPIILTIYIFVGLFNIKWIETVNFMPLFQTDLKGYIEGTVKSSLAYAGFGIGLFYIFFIDKPKNLNKNVIKGMGVTVIFYMFVFLMCIGVFGNEVTKNLSQPTLELAKRVDLPGAIFERIDAFVYTIWIMGIFNTVAMTIDVSVVILRSIFVNLSKIKIVLTFSPVVYFLSMFPKSLNQVNVMSSYIGKFSLVLGITVILMFYFIIKIKGIGKDDKKT